MNYRGGADDNSGGWNNDKRQGNRPWMNYEGGADDNSGGRNIDNQSGKRPWMGTEEERQILKYSRGPFDQEEYDNNWPLDAHNSQSHQRAGVRLYSHQQHLNDNYQRQYPISSSSFSSFSNLQPHSQHSQPYYPVHHHDQPSYTNPYFNIPQWNSSQNIFNDTNYSRFSTDIQISEMTLNNKQYSIPSSSLAFSNPLTHHPRPQPSYTLQDQLRPYYNPSNIHPIPLSNYSSQFSKPNYNASPSYPNVHPSSCSDTSSSLVEPRRRYRQPYIIHWSYDDEKKLLKYVRKHGKVNWKKVATEAGLSVKRSAQACREKWKYSRRSKPLPHFSQDEESEIVRLYEKHGNNWSRIAVKLRRPGITGRDVKKFLRKRMSEHNQACLDPQFHGQYTTEDNNNQFLNKGQSTFSSSSSFSSHQPNTSRIQHPIHPSWMHPSELHHPSLPLESSTSSASALRLWNLPDQTMPLQYSTMPAMANTSNENTTENMIRIEQSDDVLVYDNLSKNMSRLDDPPHL